MKSNKTPADSSPLDTDVIRLEEEMFELKYQKWDNEVQKINDDLIVYYNACECETCHGRKINPPKNGFEVIKSGGRHPHEIYYNPAVFSAEWITSGGKELYNIKENIILLVPASAHGCWKCSRNQKIAIVNAV